MGGRFDCRVTLWSCLCGCGIGVAACSTAGEAQDGGPTVDESAEPGSSLSTPQDAGGDLGRGETGGNTNSLQPAGAQPEGGTTSAGVADGGSEATSNGGGNATGGASPVSEGGRGGTSPQPGTGECLRPEDGSRLRRQREAGEDGSMLFHNWFDAETGVRCFFEQAADGSSRCLPPQLSSATLSVRMFTNADCSTAVAYSPWPTPCLDEGPVRYLVHFVPGEPSTCTASAYRVFELGAALAPQETYYIDGEQGCEVLQPSWGEVPPTTYEVGREMTPDEFVSVEREEVLGNRLQIRREILSDGAIDYNSLTYDTDLQTYCGAEAAADGEQRCLPFGTTLTYTDAACEEAVVQDPAVDACWSSEAAPFGTQRLFGTKTVTGGSARSSTHVFEVDEAVPVTPSATYSLRLGTDECVEIASVPLSHFAVGAEVPSDAFVRGSYQDRDCSYGASSGDRIQVQNFVWADGSPNFARGLFDTELGVNCSPSTAADGARRCLPFGRTTVSDYYADAACTVAVAQVSTGSSVPGARDFTRRNWVAEATESTSCALDRTSIFALEGSEFEITQLYGIDDQGSCVVQSVEPTGAYREVGPEVPPEQMVRYESDL